MYVCVCVCVGLCVCVSVCHVTWKLFMCLASVLVKVCVVAEEPAFSLSIYLSPYPDVPYSQKSKIPKTSVAH